MFIEIYKKEVAKKDGKGTFPSYSAKTKSGWANCKILDKTLEGAINKGINKIEVNVEDIGFKSKYVDGTEKVDTIFVKKGTRIEYTAEELNQKRQATAERVAKLFE